MATKSKLYQRISAKKRPLSYPNVSLSEPFKPYEEDTGRTIEYPPYTVTDVKIDPNNPEKAEFTGYPELGDPIVTPGYPKLNTNTFRKQPQYNLGIDKKPKAIQTNTPDNTIPEVTKKSSIGQDFKPEIIKQGEGTVGKYKVESDKKQQETGNRETTKKLAGSDFSEYVRQAMKSADIKQRQEIADAIAAHPEYGNLSSYINKVKDEQNKYETDLKTELARHTARLSQNEEANFWNKLIGALGGIAAGAIGLGTGGDVGGQYKAPDLFPKEEMDRSAQAQHDARIKDVQSRYDSQAKKDTAIMKALTDAGMSTNEAAKLLTAIPKDTTGTTSQSWNINKNTQEVKDQLMRMGFAPKDKPSDKASEKLYDFKAYIENTKGATGALNAFDNILLNENAVLNDDDFINKFANWISNSTIGVSKGSVSVNPDAVRERLQLFKEHYGNPLIARRKIIEDMKNLANGSFFNYTDEETAKAIAKGVYGLPANLINEVRGKGGKGSKSDVTPGAENLPPGGKKKVTPKSPASTGKQIKAPVLKGVGKSTSAVAPKPSGEVVTVYDSSGTPVTIEKEKLSVALKSGYTTTKPSLLDRAKGVFNAK